MTARKRLCVIIPCRGDAAVLKGLLARLNTMGVHDIIIADGAEDEACVQLAHQHGADYFASAKPRGERLRAGARRSTADIVWFLHADAVPHPYSVDAIHAALAKGADGGYFGFQLTGPRHPMAWMIERGVGLRCRMGGMPYGDQGLFASRNAYEAAGGHGDGSLFDEVPLVTALRRTGRFVYAGLPIGVNSRRWDEDGYLNRTLRNRWIALRYVMGTAPATLAKLYRASSR